MLVACSLSWLMLKLCRESNLDLSLYYNLSYVFCSKRRDRAEIRRGPCGANGELSPMRRTIHPRRSWYFASDEPDYAESVIRFVSFSILIHRLSPGLG